MNTYTTTPISNNDGHHRYGAELKRIADILIEKVEGTDGRDVLTRPITGNNNLSS